mmetsp:Transcript_29358/g.95665  ORF Transcript_29358/g.95665 Transcript_29358/m.95665 type:complete len:662 (+) Transcript_29358:116-2101(+)
MESPQSSPLRDPPKPPTGVKKPSTKVSPYMIDPRSWFMRQWDILALFLLSFTALVTPYEVAFLGQLGPDSPLWIINRLVDGCFVIDLLINFNLIMYDEDENKFIADRAVVARTYVSGFFIIDVVSILPFDEIGMATGGSPQDAAKLRVLRVVRIFRLAKLLRVLRSGRIFQRFENTMSIKYGLLKLTKFIVATTLVAHWMGCLWHLVQQIEAGKCSWVASYFGDECDRYALEVSASERYITSLYLSVMTISTVGYGDVTPETTAERVFLIIAMLTGASIYAYVVGSICGIIASMDQKEQAFYDLMDVLNTFIKENNLSQVLAQRLRGYFRYRRYCTNVAEWRDLLKHMSPSLRGEVAMQLNSDWITKVPMFMNCPQEFLIELSLTFHSAAFPPGEVMISGNSEPRKMYIIKKGVASYADRIKTANSVVGEDMISFRNAKSVTWNKAVAITYVDTYCVSKEDLSEVLDAYPHVQRMLKRRAMSMLFRDQVLTYCRFIAKLRKEFEQRVTPNMPHDEFVEEVKKVMFSSTTTDTEILTFPNRLLALVRMDSRVDNLLNHAATVLQRHGKGWSNRISFKRMVQELRETRRRRELESPYGFEGQISGRDIEYLGRVVAAQLEKRQGKRLQRLEARLSDMDRRQAALLTLVDRLVTTEATRPRRWG